MLWTSGDPLPPPYLRATAKMLTSLIFIADRWQRDQIATLFFLPYAAWVAFATLLSGSIVVLN